MVSAWGCVPKGVCLPRGVCVFLGGEGVCQGGCLPRGCLPGGCVCPGEGVSA